MAEITTSSPQLPAFIRIGVIVINLNCLSHIVFEKKGEATIYLTTLLKPGVHHSYTIKGDDKKIAELIKPYVVGSLTL